MGSTFWLTVCEPIDGRFSARRTVGTAPVQGLPYSNRDVPLIAEDDRRCFDCRIEVMGKLLQLFTNEENS